MIPNPAPSRRTAATAVLDVAVGLSGAAALVSIAIEFGFEPDHPPDRLGVLHAVQWATLLAFLLRHTVGVAIARRRFDAVRAEAFNLALLVLGAIAFLVTPAAWHQVMLKTAALYVAALSGLALAQRAARGLKQNVTSSQWRLRPARLVVLSFVGVILVGTALLMLPRATHGPGVDGYLLKHWLKCLFTATSATCVTGLTVYDTGREFTLFGQIVILVLIQAGGLGIMLVGTVFGLLFGRQLSLRESLVLQDTLAHETVGRIGRAIKFVVVTTLLIEAVGAVALYGMWPKSIGSQAMLWFYSVFHAVSAFCNAGFALDGASLMPYRGAWQVYVVIMPAIVLGGLGFPVLDNLLKVGAARGRRLAAAAAARWRDQPPTAAARTRHKPALTLHTKLVLSVTAVLILVPAIMLWALETPTAYNTSRFRVTPVGEVETGRAQETWMAGMSPGERALAALFQSVTTRTAGFHTVRIDQDALSPASHFLMCILMFVGGSPGSAAGGVKTVTITVLLLAVLTTLRRRERVEAFSRTIGVELLRRAATLVILMWSAISAFTLILCYTERGTLLEVLFEVVSACGTVGLTSGDLTARLTEIGQAVIILAMFAGRLGPLTLLIALAGRMHSAQYEYPEEPVIIG